MPLDGEISNRFGRSPLGRFSPSALASFARVDGPGGPSYSLRLAHWGDDLRCGLARASVFWNAFGRKSIVASNGTEELGAHAGPLCGPSQAGRPRGGLCHWAERFATGLDAVHLGDSRL